MCKFKQEESGEDEPDDGGYMKISYVNVGIIKLVLEKFKHAVDNCKDCEFDAKDSNDLKIHIRQNKKNDKTLR